MFGRYEKLLDMVTSLSLEVAHLNARLTELEFRKSVGLDAAEKEDPLTARANKKFAEGLDNLMSFDGRKQEAKDDE